MNTFCYTSSNSTRKASPRLWASFFGAMFLLLGLSQPCFAADPGLISGSLPRHVMKYYHPSAEHNFRHVRLAQSPTEADGPDLEVTVLSSSPTSMVGNSITYTVMVQNVGNQDVAGVQVSTMLPGNVTYLSSTPSVGTYDNTSGLWDVGTIYAGGAGNMTITVEVDDAGVAFLMAYVLAQGTADVDSQAGNTDMTEDDIASACSSIPFEYCQGQEISISASAPLGYTNYEWTDGTGAVVSSTATYEITAPGSYTFSANTLGTSCPAGLCCPVIVVELPEGCLKLGDLVWVDANNNGSFDNGESGITGITVNLVDATGTVIDTDITDGNGNYLFDGLVPGDYVVQIPSNQPGLIDYMSSTGDGLFDMDGDGAFENGTNDPDNDANFDDNGSLSGLNVASNPVTLAYDSEPINDSDIDNNSNLSVDFGFYQPEIFDLALFKTANPGIPVLGGDISYSITVLNQGTVAAYNVEVVDYLPASLTLSSNDTNGWIGSVGNITNSIPGPIAPGASVTLQMIATIDAGFTGSSIVNVAEITAADNDNDITNLPPTDDDSNPDSNPGDPQGPDNSTDNSNGDEDDSDPSVIILNAPPAFDLALTKTTMSTSVVAGGDVTFTINVINQGDVAAYNVAVIDYLPAGLTLSAADANGWVVSGGNITNSIAGPIAAGTSSSLTLVAKVSPSFVGSLTNVAEITSADNDTDPTNTPPTDEDSTPDSNPGDPQGPDNTVDNTGGDEDDNDPATITVTPTPVFDLALTKTTMSTSVVAGGDVTFTINVINQGDVAAYNVAVIDYLPAGLTLSAADANGWVVSGGNITNSIAGPIAAGTSSSLTLVAKVSPSFVGSLTNVAEITSADNDTDPTNTPPTDEDSTPDSNPGDPQGPDNTVDNTGGDEDDNDPATITVTPTPVFDLALTKTTMSTSVVAGGDVTFTINVINQGDVAAYNVAVIDYLPAGLTLSAADANGWVVSGGNITNSIAGPIAAGTSSSLTLVAKVSPSFVGSLTNVAEITSADNDTDPTNTPPTDEDSTPDSNPGDPQGPDNTVDNTGGDEDDNDPATITVTPTPVFDLALTKTTMSTSVVAGGDVTFTINVINQGDVAAYNVSVIDFLPAGLTLSAADANGWVVSGGNITNSIAGPIAAGTTASLSMVATVSPSFAGSLTNVAEISSADNDTDPNNTPPTDTDSDPDSNPGDPQGPDNTVDNTGGDEDDNDPATITVTPAPVFDLALTKTTTATSVLPGADVTFTINVINQGNVAAYNVSVIDYLPAGLTLSAADANGWVVSGGNITNSIAGPIAAGSTASLSMVATVSPSFAGSLTNVAEISSADNDTDPNNTPPTDTDSDPDSNPGDPQGPDNTVDNTGGDEDDNDPATITVTPAPVFDLALTKTTTATSVLPGADVTFTINVINQGNVAAYNVSVIDYLPAGLTLSAADANGWVVSGGNITNSIAGPIAAGSTASLSMVATVSPSFAGSLTNVAEISSADNDTDPNNTPPTDTDSDPDSNPGDPQGPDNTVDNTGGDEDDSDPATITVTPAPVFDLALTKTTTATSVLPGADVTFTINVINQGNVAAYNVSVVDYLPAGLTLSAADANGWVVSGGNITNSIAGPIAAGTSATLTLVATVSPTFAGTSLMNVAEISSADNDTDPNNTPPTDTDSDPDSNPGDPQGPDNTVDNTGGDEDDNDPALITVVQPTCVNISLPQNLQNYVYECTETPISVAALVPPVPTSDCPATVSSTVTTTTVGCTEITTITWTAVDGEGNSATATQTITVQDTQAPVLTMTHPGLAGVASGSTLTFPCGQMPAMNASAGTAVDACCTTGVTVTFSETNLVVTACGTSVTCIWTATDCCGNTSSFYINVAESDLTAPVIAGITPNTIANPILVGCGETVPPTPAGIAATDNCDTNVPVVMNETTAPNACGYMITRTWTATDNCGNTSVVSQHVQVTVDNTPPVFAAVPATVSVDCGSIIPAATAVTATDACGIPAITFTEAQIGSGCTYKLVRQWVATDACGNSSIANQIVNVNDGSAPAMTAPANATISCGSPLPSVAAPAATDACSAATVVYVGQTESGTACNKTYIRTWSATDACGNTATVSQTITVIDNTAPAISFTHPDLVGVANGSTLTYQCNSMPAFNQSTATVTDACSAATVVFSESNLVLGNCALNEPKISVTCMWTATDACGNTSTFAITVKGVDTTPPTMSGVPANATVACGQTVPAAATITAIDNCEGTTVVTMTETTAAVGCNNVITRTWTATDACGNATTASQQISVMNDTNAPTFANAPANVTVACGSVPTVQVVTATDACNTATVAFAETTTGNNCDKTITRIWTATDACGNVATHTQVITVEDNQGPVITLTHPAVAGAQNGDVLEFFCTNMPVLNASNATAVDACGNGATITFSEANLVLGNCANGTPLLSVTCTWTAVDNCGNTSTISLNMQKVDNQAPTLAGVPANATVACGQTVPAVANPTATDACSNATVTFAETSAQVGCNQVITRTWTATDACGNATSASQLITVNNDNQAPALVGVPTNATVACGQSVPAVANVTGTDACSTTATVAFAETSAQSGCSQIITRTWTATDACGNTASASQVITVSNDGVAPVLAGVPANTTVACGQSVPTVANPTATDACTTANVTFAEASAQVGCNQVITRTWTATDACGNATSAAQIITVNNDSAVPTLVGVPAAATVACGQTVPAPASVTATDACSTASVTFAETSAMMGCNQVITRTWTATDACGNATSASQMVTVSNDDDAPALVGVPADLTVPCGGILPVVPTVTASDACSTTSAVQFAQTSVIAGCTETLTRTWTATDACGNATSDQQIITIVTDNVPPVFNSMPADLTLACGTVMPVVPNMTATDACATAVNISYAENTVSNTCETKVFRIWTATDACGNTSTTQQVITFNDTTDPVLAGVPANTTVDLDNGGTIPTPANVTANDACSSATVLFAEVTVPGTCGYSIVRTWTATDVCGNTTSASQTITVTDNITASAVVTPVSCAVNDGTATLAPATLTYTWADAFVGATRNDLTMGTYTVIASNGSCTTAVTFTIEENCSCNNTEEFVETFLEAPATSCEGSVAVCLPINNALAQAFVFSIDGVVYTGALPACTGGTELMVPVGYHNVTIFNPTFGCTDTIIVKVSCPDLLVKTATVENGNFATYCMADMGYGNITSAILTCENEGSNATITFDPLTNCFMLEGLALGTDTICFNVCNDLGQCTDGILIVTTVPGNCPELFGNETVYAGGNCAGLTNVCIQLPLQDVINYDIMDNGMVYTGGLEGCDFDTTLAYTYFTIPGMGNVGPYSVDYWTVNSATFSGTVANVNSLVDFMNTNDPFGNWQILPSSLTIFGGDPAKTYGTMKVTQINTGAFAILELNTNLIPNGTQVALSAGLHELQFINSITGCADVLDVEIVCPEALHISALIPTTALDTMCLDMSELSGELVSVTNACEGASGTAVNFTIIPGTNCIVCTGQEVGVEQACFVLTDSYGISDTTYLTVTVYAVPSEIIPFGGQDSVQTLENTPIVIEVLNNDTLNGDLVSIEIVTPPNIGQVIITAENNVLYVPATDWCSDIESDFFTYMICNNAGCDDVPVTVQVFCNGVTVFNGVSPNGDGINDVLTIQGLINYPNNSINIYNRWGTQVYDSKGAYQNNWGGTWNENKILPDGTYFYFLKLSETETKSGYIQIKR
jgi:gliding motility-associated-like protein/uncharacterized repeat protein (TIGR01451 family)